MTDAKKNIYIYIKNDYKLIISVVLKSNLTHAFQGVIASIKI